MKSTTDFDEITVFGTHGHSVMILRCLEDHWQGRVRVRALIDDIENGFIHPELAVPVVSSAERLRCWSALPVLLTPGSTALRARIMAQLVAEDATLATVINPGHGHVDPGVSYGAGCLCAPFTRLGPRVTIGEGAQILATIVAHDVEIGACSNLLVQSSVMGHVIIGREVNVAPSAVIANGSRDRPLRIGDGAVIGVGAVVVRDVPPGARMVGNPAMPVERWKALNRLLDGAMTSP